MNISVLRYKTMRLFSPLVLFSLQILDYRRILISQPKSINKNNKFHEHTTVQTEILLINFSQSTKQCKYKKKSFFFCIFNIIQIYSCAFALKNAF